ncbi:MAG: hypothetical protein J6P76_06545 [Acidaminococcaceae bacterium]|nr:hypothetical protein [Acidaminococcaceae bacterium]
MEILLQPPYRYIVSFILFFVLFWLCQNYGATMRKLAGYVLALTILALLAYTAIALLYMLMQQP